MIVTEYMENGSLDAFLRVCLPPLGEGCTSITAPTQVGYVYSLTAYGGCVWMLGVCKQHPHPPKLASHTHGEEAGMKGILRAR